MFYFGFIERDAFRSRFGKDLIEVFKEEIEYLKLWSLAVTDEQRLTVTRNGVTHLGGVIPMFYSDRSKQELMNMNPDKWFNA
jgi:oxygen-independent coproporphyrinogen-3 oxidase